MNEIKKGNSGNFYLQRILDKLGNDYTSTDLDIKTNNMRYFNIKHTKCGNIFQINWKQASENSKCPYCFKNGHETSDRYFSEYIESMYNGDFTFNSYEFRREVNRFFNITHKKCNNSFWISSFAFSKKRPVCPMCEKSMTTDIFKEKLKEKYGDEYIVLGEYAGLNKPIKIKHMKCNSIIETIRPNNILYMGQGCKKCGMLEVGRQMKERRAPEFYKELKEKFGDRFILETEYNGYHEKIIYYDTLLDKVCANKPADILKKSLKPGRSKGEERIAKWLKDSDIIFDEQKTFSDLKDKGLLRFDFYIEAINLCIEFDGEQHFKARRDDPTGERLKILQYHDNMKNEYCKSNNIKLLRITYKQFKKIEKILEAFFQQGS